MKSILLCHCSSQVPADSKRRSMTRFHRFIYKTEVMASLLAPGIYLQEICSSLPLQSWKAREQKWQCKHNYHQGALQGIVFHEDQTPATISKGIHGIQIDSIFLQISFIFFQNTTYRVKILKVMLRRLTCSGPSVGCIFLIIL